MIAYIGKMIVKTNQAYDDLANTNPTLRFFLFLSPILIGLEIDIILLVLKITSTPIFEHIAIVLMALWRIPFIFLSKPKK